VRGIDRGLPNTSMRLGTRTSSAMATSFRRLAALDLDSPSGAAGDACDAPPGKTL
jgi:hypothetical protein